MNEIPTTKQKHLPKDKIQITAQIFVISDSLHKIKKAGNSWKEQDKSGKIAENVLHEKLPEYKSINLEVIPDEQSEIFFSVEKSINNGISLILTLGGTGISNRDVTIETISPLFEKELTGFGELFRIKTYESVGTISIMTRATAGVSKQSCIVCLPGSPNATRLGLEILLSELNHILALRMKY